MIRTNNEAVDIEAEFIGQLFRRIAHGACEQAKMRI
jgi:hypothetical protein